MSGEEDKKHHNIGPGNDVLDMEPKAQIIKVKMCNWNYIKLNILNSKREWLE